MEDKFDFAREHNFLADILGKLQILESNPAIKNELFKKFDKMSSRLKAEIDKKMLEDIVLEMFLNGDSNPNDFVEIKSSEGFKTLRSNIKNFLANKNAKQDFPKQSEINNYEAPNSRNNRKLQQKIHAPQELTKILKLITAENHLKYSTHEWDNTNDSYNYENYEEFISKLEPFFNEYFVKIKYFHRDLYYLVFPFLNQNKLMKHQVEGHIPFKWGKYGIKVGWRYPQEFWSSLSDEELKNPFNIILPKMLQPPNRINGNYITKFHQVIDLFKNEIEFRRTSFKNMVDSAFENKKSDHNLIGIDSLNSVEFYTFTTNIERAVNIVASNLDSNYSSVEFEIKDEKDYYVFRITQLDSFAHKRLDDDKLNLIGGSLISMYDLLYGLCDWSIINKFQDNNYWKFIYLDNKRPPKNPKEIIKNKIKEADAFKGFTHLFKFYK